MRIVLDKPRCIGSGNCVLAAEDLFDLDEEGTVELRRQPERHERAAAEEAVRACPTATIAIAED